MLFSKAADVQQDVLLEIRFDGPELQLKSVPIYELGRTLMAVQRMVNKAYLFTQGRLIKGARPNERTRQLLDLQIVSNSKGSDVYGLTTFFTDPSVVDTAKDLLVQFLAGILVYTVQKINENQEQVSDDQPYIVAIFPDMQDISRRLSA